MGALRVSLPDWQLADTLPDGLTANILADGVTTPNITRAMGLVPVNAPQATSVVGHSPSIDDEFRVTHLISTRPNRLDKSSDGRLVNDHQGNISS